MGESERAGIERRWDVAASRAHSDLVSRGLAGTTVAPTMAMGIERERGAALGGLEERLARMRLGYDTAITQARLGAMERREDVGPDYGMLMEGLPQRGDIGMELLRLGTFGLASRSRAPRQPEVGYF
jgi:hypothetical protein